MITVKPGRLWGKIGNLMSLPDTGRHLPISSSFPTSYPHPVHDPPAHFWPSVLILLHVTSLFPFSQTSLTEAALDVVSCGNGPCGDGWCQGQIFPSLVLFLVLIPTAYSGVLPPSAGRAQHLQLSSVPSKFLNWKGPTRISEPSSWPCREHSKNPIRCLRALSKCLLNSRRAGAALAGLFCKDQVAHGTFGHVHRPWEV